MEDLYPTRKSKEEILTRVDKTVYSNMSLGEKPLDNILRKEYEEKGFLIIPNAFNQHLFSSLFDKVSRESKILDKVKQLL